MSADRILLLKLMGDTSSIDKSLRKSEGKLKSFGRSAARWGTAIAADLAIEGIEKVADALGDAWTGFREGEKASAQLGVTWKNLGNDGSKLQSTIDAISDSTLALGTDDTEAINAFNEALKTTGGDSTKAMQRLKIAQDLVANGSAPDLASAMKIIQSAASGSKRTMDKFGLSADTAGGRVKELGKKVRGAAKAKADMDPLGVLFNALNEDLEGIVGSLASGDLEGGMKNFAQMGDDVAAAWGRIDAKATPTLDKLTGGAFSGLKTDLDGVLANLAPLGGLFDKAAGGIDAISAAFQTAQPHLQNAGALLAPLASLPIQSLTGLFSMPFDTGKGILGAANALAHGDLPGALDSLSTMLTDLLGDFDQVFAGIPSKIINAIPGVTSAAAAFGQGIFDGLIGWLSGIPAAITRMWNSIDLRIPALDLAWPAMGFDIDLGPLADLAGQPRHHHLGIDAGKFHLWDGIADVFPDVGGGKNPTGTGNYKKGLWDVPVDDMPAFLHKGESVLPAPVAADFRQHYGGGGGAVINVTVNAPPLTDPVAVGQEVLRVLKAASRRDGGAAFRAIAG